MDFYPYQYTPPEKKPLPPPNENWVDHVKDNRKYLQSIKKVGISKQFKGLKETMMYLMEVSCDSVEINKPKSDNVKVSTKDDFRLYVKFLDYLFWEVDGNDQPERPKDSPSYSDLFQSMFTPANNIITVESSSKTDSEKEILDEKQKKPEIVEKIPDTKEENKKARDKTTSPKKSGHKKSKGKKESKGSKARGRSKDSDKSKEVKAENDIEIKETKETTDHKKVEETKDEQNKKSKGKASLFLMKGEKLIRSLQEHSINVKMTEKGEKTEDTKTEDTTSGTHSQKKPEGVVLANTSFRVPESFRMAVLSFSDRNTELPSREKHSDTYKLMDAKKEEIGKVNVTVTLTCFGKMVENCIREEEDGDKYTYEHTRCWRTFSEQKAKIPKINPKLALHLMNTAAKFIPIKWNSDEILRNVIGLGLIKVDDEERRRAMKRNKCKWHRLAKQSKFEINSKCEEDELISALKTSKKLKCLESSCTVIKSPPKTFRSVVELTTVVSSTVVTSGAFIAEKTEWATSCISRNVPRPKDNLHTVPIDKIREATENEDLKELWIKQRIINKAFKEEQIEKTRRKPSVYERLEKLRLEAGDIRASADQRPTKESIKSSIVNVEK